MRVCTCSLAYPACNAFAPCVICGLCLHHISRHYLINGTIFGKKLWNIKCVVWFSLRVLSETFLILRRIRRDTVINAKTSSCKVRVILVGFQGDLNFLRRFSKKKAYISNCVKICPLGVELFYADGYDDANSRFSQFANAIEHQSVNSV